MEDADFPFSRLEPKLSSDLTGAFGQTFQLPLYRLKDVKGNPWSTVQMPPQILQVRKLSLLV